MSAELLFCSSQLPIAAHVDKISEGVKSWDLWRLENSDVNPDLSQANLRDAILTKADLTRTALWQTMLSGADLAGANLASANLASADLYRTDLVV